MAIYGTNMPPNLSWLKYVSAEDGQVVANFYDHRLNLNFGNEDKLCNHRDCMQSDSYDGFHQCYCYGDFK